MCYTLASMEMIPYDLKDHINVNGDLNSVIGISESFVPIAAHRTRKDFAKRTEILVGRGC